MPSIYSFFYIQDRRKLRNRALERYGQDKVYNSLGHSGFWHHHTLFSALFCGLQLFQICVASVVQALIDRGFLLCCYGGTNFKYCGFRGDQGSDKQVDFHWVLSAVCLRVGHPDHRSVPVAAGPRTSFPHEFSHKRYRRKLQQGALHTEAHDYQHLLDNAITCGCPGTN